MSAPALPAKPEQCRLMRLAIGQARRGAGRVSPNPMVGTVIVKDGQVVGRGWHRGAGQPHAEVEALRNAGELAQGADAYVNLEPCSHVGRTPPCAPELVKAGVARVFIGMVDPNPRVNGEGIRLLEAAGIRVITGVCEDECRELNAAFVTWITEGRPRVTVKLAMTLDGRIASRTGASQWISSEASRKEVHKLRREVDAVMVGSGTVVADDPRLTARLGEQLAAEQPRRIVIDSALRTPPTAKLLQGEGGPVLIATRENSALSPAGEALREAGAELLVVSTGENDKLQLDALLQELGRRELMHLLVEGGGAVSGALLDAGLVDELRLFIAPRLMGGADAVPALGGLGAENPALAWRLSGMRSSDCGGDLLVVGVPTPAAPEASGS